MYERAFLCSLPRKMWQTYAAQLRSCRQRELCWPGFFFYG